MTDEDVTKYHAAIAEVSTAARALTGRLIDLMTAAQRVPQLVAGSPVSDAAVCACRDLLAQLVAGEPRVFLPVAVPGPTEGSN